MQRTIALVGFLGLQAGVFLVGPSLIAADEPKDTPPCLKVMEDNFSGKKNVHRAIKKKLRSARAPLSLGFPGRDATDPRTAATAGSTCGAARAGVGAIKPRPRTPCTGGARRPAGGGATSTAGSSGVATSRRPQPWRQGLARRPAPVSASTSPGR